MDQNVQGTTSDSDSIGEDDDDSDESFLPSGRNNSTNSGMIDSNSIEHGANVTGIGAIGLSPSKSPTQSVRSLLSRPRTTPQRRATISGSSPSLCRPYINISEVAFVYKNLINFKLYTVQSWVEVYKLTKNLILIF